MIAGVFCAIPVPAIRVQQTKEVANDASALFIEKPPWIPLRSLHDRFNKIFPGGGAVRKEAI